MLMQCVAIKDRALDTFGPPMFVHTLAQGIRAFTDAINDPNNHVSKHPDDYDLWHLAAYDDAEGTFTNLPKPIQIAIGKNACLTYPTPSASPTKLVAAQS